MTARVRPDSLLLVRSFFVALLVMTLLGVLLVPAIAKELIPPWSAGVYALAFLGLIPVAAVAALRKGWRNFTLNQFRNADKVLERLKTTDQLTSISYQAVRAFQVEEFEDEGSIYFVELADGSVLFLCGQYLYDYEPNDDDPSHPQSRRFPCTDFTVHRRKTEDWVAEIDCQGSVLESEVLTPAFAKDRILHGSIPGDGDIFSDRTYDQLKRDLLRQKA